MASNMAVNILRQGLQKNKSFCLLRRQLSGPVVVFNKEPSTTNTTTSEYSNVPGLSTAVHSNEEPVGPGAAKSGEYKVPEYYNFNKTSYFEAEIEIAKFRCPQPSAVEQ